MCILNGYLQEFINKQYLKNIQNHSLFGQCQIIKGFKYILDTSKLDINKSRLFLKLHNLTIESEESLTEYMLKTKEIITINKTVGDWNLEIDIESSTKNRI